MSSFSSPAGEDFIRMMMVMVVVVMATVAVIMVVMIVMTMIMMIMMVMMMTMVVMVIVGILHQILHSCPVLQGTADFRLKHDNQSDDAEVEEIIQNVLHHAQLQNVGHQPNPQQEENPFYQLFRTRLPHKFDHAENDEGD